MDRSRARRWLIPAAPVLMLACLGCSALGFALVRGPTGPPSSQMGTEICAGLALRPRFQVGIAVLSPLTSYRPPLVDSPYALCLRLPAPLLGPRLHWIWLFPP